MNPHADAMRMLLFSLCGLAMLWTMAPGASAQDAEHRGPAACLRDHEQAQELQLQGDYLAARTHLLACAQSHCPGPVSGECIRGLADVDRSLPSLVFAVVGADGRDLVDVHVLADGAMLAEQLDGRAIPLNPGVYHLRFEAEGHVPAERVLTVREAQKQRLVRVELDAVAGAPGAARPLEPERAGERPRAGRRLLASGVLAGTAVASLGVGIGLGAAGRKELNRLDESCGESGCTTAQRAHGKRLYIAADVAFGATLGVAVAAVWLFVAARNADRPPAKAWLRFQPVLHRTGVGLRYRLLL